MRGICVRVVGSFEMLIIDTNMDSAFATNTMSSFGSTARETGSEPTGMLGKDTVLSVMSMTVTFDEPEFATNNSFAFGSTAKASGAVPTRIAGSTIAPVLGFTTATELLAGRAA